MKIGILSDTHDNLNNLEKAVQLFREKGIHTLIHAGDFVSPFVLRAMEGKIENLVGVFGNNDGDKLMLRNISDKAGWSIVKPPHSLTLADKRFLIMHEPDILEIALQSGLYDTIIYGHTHKIDIIREKQTLVINPGETGGWLSGEGSAVILDTDTMKEELFTF